MCNVECRICRNFVTVPSFLSPSLQATFREATITVFWLQLICRHSGPPTAVSFAQHTSPFMTLASGCLSHSCWHCRRHLHATAAAGPTSFAPGLSHSAAATWQVKCQRRFQPSDNFEAVRAPSARDCVSTLHCLEGHAASSGMRVSLRCGSLRPCNLCPLSNQFPCLGSFRPTPTGVAILIAKP